MFTAANHTIETPQRLLMLPAHDARELDGLAALPPALALRQGLPVVRRLARAWAALLAADRGPAASPGAGGGPQIVRHAAGRAGAWWLGFFRWAPGAATPIHDHTSWGIYSCAGGTLAEERYRRLDAGDRPQRARLRALPPRRWGAGQSAALPPYPGGIHRVSNPGAAPAWSVHLYGPRLGPLDGRDYDPARDYVCDRWA